MDFYAHSTQRMDKANWQPLREHLIGVGNLAAQFATPFGGDVLARLAG